MVIPLDWYYAHDPALSFDERCARNYDHPDALDWERFFDDLQCIMTGEAFDAPSYDFSTHLRGEESHRVEAVPYFIFEGLYALWQPSLRAYLQHRIFVDTSMTECLRRRLARDTTERGRSRSEVTKRFRADVGPMYREYVRPTQEHADHVLSGEHPFETEVERLLVDIG